MVDIKEIHLVTVKRYAEIWNLDRSTIHRKIKAGLIQVYVTPKYNRFLNPHENPNNTDK